MNESKPNTDVLDAWLDLQSWDELARSVLSSRRSVTLPQARRLTTHLHELRPAAPELRLGFLHTYTSHLLDPWLQLESALQGMPCEVYHAPYGWLVQEGQPGSGLLRHQPDVTVLLLQREDLHPAFGSSAFSATRGEYPAAHHDEALDRLHSLVAGIRRHLHGLLVVTLLPRMCGPGLGLFDAHAERSETAWWAGFKAELAARLRAEVPSSLFLDLDEVLAEQGRGRFFDPRLWYSAAYPFTAEAAREVARRIVAVGSVTKHPRAKVIALDADNTLWGGIIGEDGLSGIALGPEYPGNTYVAFQRRLLEFQQRGFVLVLCSKNNPADLDEVLTSHPHQVLRPAHFAARRVNWDAKPRNLLALAQELNLGLDSFVFVDDSDHECAAVRHELPQVQVVQTPRNPVEIPTCLDRVARLEILALTSEDLAKTEQYEQQRRRQERLEQVGREGGDLDAYLRSLKMSIQVSFDDAVPLARLAQLTQKTNQFNLTTRRYQERQVREFIDSPDWLVAHFSMKDMFGDSGIVGLAIVRRLDNARAELDSFLMSCRVIGRQAETAFLETVLERLAAEGFTEIVADYLPTPKNELVRTFLPEHGFRETGDGRFIRSFSTMPPVLAPDFPVHVEPVSDPINSKVQAAK